MSAAAGLPWYRHFWPWFVVGLLGVSVVGSLTTVYIAVSGRDPEVVDTWSKDAKAVTRDDAPERLARRLGLAARVVALEGEPTIRVWLSGPDDALPAHLTLWLVHPTLESRDLALTLERSASGAWDGPLPLAVAGRYQIAIEGEAPGATRWRLGDRVDLVRGRTLELGAPPAPPSPIAPAEAAGPSAARGSGAPSGPPGERTRAG